MRDNTLRIGSCFDNKTAANCILAALYSKEFQQ